MEKGQEESRLAAMGEAAQNLISQPEIFVRETEFFGFTPISFVDDVINSVNEYLYRALDHLQTYFSAQRTTQGSPDFQQEIQKVGNQFFCLSPNFTFTRRFHMQGLDQVVTLLEAALDRNFDKFELYVLKNIFRFPQSLVLPHHQVFGKERKKGKKRKGERRKKNKDLFFFFLC